MRTETWQAVKALLATDPPDALQWQRLAALAPSGAGNTAAAVEELKMLPQQRVAELLGVSVRTLLNWGHAGLLTPVRPSARLTLYRMSEVARLLETQAGPGQRPCQAA